MKTGSGEVTKDQEKLVELIWACLQVLKYNGTISENQQNQMLIYLSPALKNCKDSTNKLTSKGKFYQKHTKDQLVTAFTDESEE